MKQRINFETAKLAKEKGFDEQVSNYWHPNYEGSNDMGTDNFNRDSWREGYYSLPTQSALQTWLRNKHGLFAYIDWASNEAVLLDYKYADGKELIREDTYDYVPDHEAGEVLERLLFETLKHVYI